MQFNRIICHYNEIALKGKNRKYFEKKLAQNIQDALAKNIPGGVSSTRMLHDRILLEINPSPKTSSEKITAVLKNIFGLSHFSFALETERDMEVWKNTALELISEHRGKSFRITAKRSDKRFPLSSMEINRQIGGFIVEKTGKKVDLENPTVNCFIEISNKKSFIHTEKIQGAGGLPVGTSGKILTLLSGGIDSPVASYYALKRGATSNFVHFHSIPYTSRESLEKVKKLARTLSAFQLSSKIYSVPFADIQKEIMLKTPPKLRVILYRRMMVRIAEKIAKKENSIALYTGDSLGQVASQTLENISAVGEAVKIPILRPLIGFDKEEIITKAKQIGTFEISQLPHDDCCTRFTPKNPETGAKIKEVKEAEKNLKISSLVNTALKKIDIFEI